MWTHFSSTFIYTNIGRKLKEVKTYSFGYYQCNAHNKPPLTAAQAYLNQYVSQI